MNAEPLIVISPHLDDAVLGCGQLLAAHPGSVVVTLFAGRPPIDQPLTPWDARAGFEPGDDVVGTRRLEDAEALRALRARPCWLEFRDAQYGGGAEEIGAVAGALGVVLARLPGPVVLGPLGLYHADHRRAREALLAVRARAPRARDWLLYADAIYRTEPGAVDAALAELRRRRICARPVSLTTGCLAQKVAAVSHYRSQLRALGRSHRTGMTDTRRPERFFRIEA
jgi:LmbE family N-acetylglucosaminyl deacetylase